MSVAHVVGIAASTGFGDFLVRAGAVTSGTIAIGGSVGLVVGAIAKDLGAEVDHWELATRGVAYGALFGVDL